MKLKIITSLISVSTLLIANEFQQLSPRSQDVVKQAIETYTPKQRQLEAQLALVDTNLHLLRHHPKTWIEKREELQHSIPVIYIRVKKKSLFKWKKRLKN